ncbi:EthD family reductase [Agrobacterium sp. Ap1]|uniref:EthD family reductase n=1 Tax=Agrobacterium sp. Ap1 TaxID=2815337 RepID=UPI001A8E0DD6|nr:EthD family reductase [Agrobacterium sp. Ap1]MBO0144637.1 EthD family reductase [Agrobacterium sp. Ap1]
MENSRPKVSIFVTYQGTTETRFDKEYYVATHLPLAIEAWGKYGLDSAEAFFPTNNKEGTIALAELKFTDENALQASFGSVEAPSVMSDVINFTDVAPVISRAVAL